MNYELTDEQASLLDAVGRLFSDAASPAGHTPGTATVGDARLWRQLGATGVLGVGVGDPEDYGTATDATIVAIAAGRHIVNVPLAEADGFAAPMLEAADDELLGAHRTGEACVIPVAPASGSSGALVAFADVATHFLVMESQPTVHARDAVEVSPQPTMGPVPVARVRAPADTGRPLAVPDEAHVAATGRYAVVAAAACVGGMERLVEVTRQYVMERVQFGRPIGSFQAVQHRLADMATAAELSRLLAFRAAEDLTAVVPAAAGRWTVADVACEWITGAYERVARSACQLHGGYGFTLEYEPQAHLRVARTRRSLLAAPVSVQGSVGGGAPDQHSVAGDLAELLSSTLAVSAHDTRDAEG